MNAPSWLHCKPRSPFLPVQAEPVEAPSLPALVFKAPYFLDFLDLRQGHDEADLEATILRQIEAFIESGALKLENAFARATADACSDIIWRALGLSRDQPSDGLAPANITPSRQFPSA